MYLPGGLYLATRMFQLSSSSPPCILFPSVPCCSPCWPFLSSTVYPLDTFYSLPACVHCFLLDFVYTFNCFCWCPCQGSFHPHNVHYYAFVQLWSFLLLVFQFSVINTFNVLVPLLDKHVGSLGAHTVHPFFLTQFEILSSLQFHFVFHFVPQVFESPIIIVTIHFLKLFVIISFNTFSSPPLPRSSLIIWDKYIMVIYILTTRIELCCWILWATFLLRILVADVVVQVLLKSSSFTMVSCCIIVHIHNWCCVLVLVPYPVLRSSNTGTPSANCCPSCSLFDSPLTFYTPDVRRSCNCLGFFASCFIISSPSIGKFRVSLTLSPFLLTFFNVLFCILLYIYIPRWLCSTPSILLYLLPFHWQAG